MGENIIFSIFHHVDLEYKRKNAYPLKKVGGGKSKSPELNKHSDGFQWFVTCRHWFWIIKCSGATPTPAPYSIPLREADAPDFQLQVSYSHGLLSGPTYACDPAEPGALEWHLCCPSLREVESLRCLLPTDRNSSWYQTEVNFRSYSNQFTLLKTTLEEHLTQKLRK